MTAVTEHHAESGHHEAPEVISRRDRMGVLLLIFADAAFVGALVFTWFYLRTLNQGGNWIPKDVEVVASSQSWIVTGVAGISAALMFLGLVAVRKGQVRQLLTFALLALVVLITDLYLQVQALDSFPFTMKNGTYASTMFALAGANIFHLGITIFLSIGIVNRIRMGRYSQDDHGHIREVTYWWIWVAVASAVTSFATMYTY
jgi:heme/copper-type cytochrome/quinol oxidase subunit 3